MNGRWKMVALALSLCAGCATSFTGNAHVEGPAQCASTCNAGMMEFAGMVYMGEYTSGCICRARLAVPAAPQASLDDASFAAAAAPAVVGVVLQRRRIEAAQGH